MFSYHLWEHKFKGLLLALLAPGHPWSLPWGYPRVIHDSNLIGVISQILLWSVNTPLVSDLCRTPQLSNHCYSELHGPTSLAPTNEESAWLAEENLKGKKPRTSAVNVYMSVDSFWLLTTSVSVCKRVETYIDYFNPSLLCRRMV